MNKDQNLGVCAILFNPQGKILLGQRKNGYKAGFWGLPGGRVEINEPLMMAIKREVKEETGIFSDKFVYFGVVRENQGKNDFLHFVYKLEKVTVIPQLLEPDKCEGWQWLEMDKIENLLPGHQLALKLLNHPQILIDVTS